MIFKQVNEIIEGKKTQTRRIVKDEEFGVTGQWVRTHIGDKIRLKWQVGRKYAVVPKMNQPQVYYRYDDDELVLAHEPSIAFRDESWMEYGKQTRGDEWREYLLNNFFHPLYIEITNIRCESLQDITEADALAEGCSGLWNADKLEWSDYLEPQYRYFRPNPIAQYIHLWESINGKGSWSKNPRVWVLEFQKVEA